MLVQFKKSVNGNAKIIYVRFVILYVINLNHWKEGLFSDVNENEIYLVWLFQGGKSIL